MNVLINIGLAKPDGSHMAASTALAAVRARGLNWDEAKLHTSSTEETVVLKLVIDEPLVTRTLGVNVRRSFTRSIGYVANDLGQDCIAVLFDDDAGEPEGALIGPRAAAWGQFDPAQFLLLDGSRLS